MRGDYHDSRTPRRPKRQRREMVSQPTSERARLDYLLLDLDEQDDVTNFQIHGEIVASASVKVKKFIERHLGA